MKHFGLTKNEILTKQIHFDELYSSGQFRAYFPIGIQYKKSCNGETKVAFKVSKRKIKKAVVRNLLKRRMKEAFRINKNILHKTTTGWLVSFVYLTTEEKKYTLIEAKVCEALRFLSRNE